MTTATATLTPDQLCTAWDFGFEDAQDGIDARQSAYYVARDPRHAEYRKGYSAALAMMRQLEADEAQSEFTDWRM